jgi:hypothetical protein
MKNMKNNIQHSADVIGDICGLLEKSQEDPLEFLGSDVGASTGPPGNSLKRGTLGALVVLGFIANKSDGFRKVRVYLASRESLNQLKGKLEIHKSQPPTDFY